MLTARVRTALPPARGFILLAIAPEKVANVRCVVVLARCRRGRVRSLGRLFLRRLACLGFGARALLALLRTAAGLLRRRSLLLGSLRGRLDGGALARHARLARLALGSCSFSHDKSGRPHAVQRVFALGQSGVRAADVHWVVYVPSARESTDSRLLTTRTPRTSSCDVQWPCTRTIGRRTTHESRARSNRQPDSRLAPHSRSLQSNFFAVQGAKQTKAGRMADDAVDDADFELYAAQAAVFTNFSGAADECSEEFDGTFCNLDPLPSTHRPLCCRLPAGVSACFSLSLSLSLCLILWLCFFLSWPRCA